MARNHRRRRNRLALEKLEDRRLLAVAAFEAELYSDVDGVPGELLADNTVTAGETFFLRVTAREFDRFRDGLGSAAVSIDWDPELIQVVEAEFQLDSVITSDLPLMQTGSLDNDSGAIDDLSGLALLSAGSGRAIGNGVAETFAMIRMQAGSGAGQSEIELSESQKKTITVPTTVLRGDDLRFETESITVVAAATADADAVPPPDENAPSAVKELTEPSENGEESVSLESMSIPGESHNDQTPPETNEDAPPEAAANTLTTTPEAESTPEGESTTEEEADRIVVVARPVALELTEPPQNENETAAAVDEVLSFDLNEDGVFDFADFGLLNVNSATVQSETPSGSESLPQPADDPSVGDDSGQLPFHGICTAAPPRDDVPAFEAWMDALAAAWIADAEARADRRETSTLF